MSEGTDAGVVTLEEGDWSWEGKNENVGNAAIRRRRSAARCGTAENAMRRTGATTSTSGVADN